MQNKFNNAVCKERNNCKRYETIVIGAGQAGLAMGYYLKQAETCFLIIDKASSIGEVWRDRYDSLKLFTPRMYNSLPGILLEGEPHGFPLKDEIADYLQNYSTSWSLPIIMGTEVLKVTKIEGSFFVMTTCGTFTATNIVVATGSFQTKRIPSFSKSLNETILQFHSSEYKNPSQLQEGNVLVVGGGNSGAQIAVELSAEKDTYLAVSKKPHYFPLTLGGKSVFWWFDKLGILKVMNKSLIGKMIQKKGDPIFGTELSNAVKTRRIVVKGRVENALRNKITFEDLSTLEVSNVIWATGFHQEYEWLKIDDVFDKQRDVIHDRGISPVTGLYFLGLPWQSRRGSSLLEGVGYDAAFIMEYMEMTDLQGGL